MYKKILAPLDGSQFSECSLPHLKAIAAGCNVPEVVVLRIVEPISAQSAAALLEVGADWLTKAEQDNKREAENYIAGAAAQLKMEGLTAHGVTAFGDPAEQILEYVNNNQIDLVIMSTHGKSGVTRWVFGSVTDRVLRNSAAPVLVMSPAGCRTTPTPPKKL